MNVNVKEKLYKQIKDYCSINNLPIGEYINDLLQKAFMVDKYGDKPSVLNVSKKKEEKPIVVVEEQNEADDKKELDFLKETVKSALTAYQKPTEEITLENIKKAIEIAKEEEKTEKIKPSKRKLK